MCSSAISPTITLQNQDSLHKFLECRFVFLAVTLSQACLLDREGAPSSTVCGVAFYEGSCLLIFFLSSLSFAISARLPFFPRSPQAVRPDWVSADCLPLFRFDPQIVSPILGSFSRSIDVAVSSTIHRVGNFCTAETERTTRRSPRIVSTV